MTGGAKRQFYVYDAWNRLVKVERGTEEVVVATLSYDGLGRRVKKTVPNSGDWNATYHWYWSRSWQVLEERNGSNGVLRQYVYGTRYVDNPVQIGINDDPSDAGEDDCETFYYPVQDANFNVTALVGSWAHRDKRTKGRRKGAARR